MLAVPAFWLDLLWRDAELCILLVFSPWRQRITGRGKDCSLKIGHFYRPECFFTGSPLTFNFQVAQMLNAGGDSSQRRRPVSGVFGDSVHKSLRCAERCLAELPEQLVVLPLLLERLVEEPTWHDAATCLGPSQQHGVTGDRL